MAKRIKTGGRKKNTPNHSTKELRNIIQCLLENNINNLQTDIDELLPKDRISVILKLSSLCLPSLQNIAIQNENENDKLEQITIFEIPNDHRND